MTALLVGRLRELATQTHLLEKKVDALGWMAANGPQTLKSMTRAQAHLMLAERDLLDAIENNEKERMTMSEKPFWEGKTCEEMAGLPVKAVFKNGVTITGQLSRFGGIPISTEGMNSPISISSNTLNFRPHREISSVELLDSLEYERVDNIENVQVGDIFVANDGNQYLIDAEDKDDKAATFRAYLSYAGEMWLSNCAFAYALRRKPKLPDHDGLWLDKDGNTWTMRDGSVQCTCIGADNWGFTRMWFSPDSKQVLPSAPFRPAKAVEA